ncbi:MAG: type III-B CRISPR-associated protein Cas10/Cmr2 [Limnochordaceae bacterium]|nr:type III-B CRISPR-associated protein Cas10/Cmr2 [Limnochordaceae bacterium]
MSGYLLTLSLGPVQEFIAAARKTRDLWFGSHMLSEISKAAARALYDEGAKLIFPAPCDACRLDPESDLLVANRVLAQVPGGLDPGALAERARKAAQDRWLDFARSALEFAGERAVDMDVWNEQVGDVIEFYAAWVPFNENAEKGYLQARQRLEQIMAGRKACRDFLPAKGRAGIPKSSLDGARESVLARRVSGEADESDSSKLRLRLRIKRNEHLDAIGLVKRCAAAKEGDRDVQFVSVARVAADAWIRRQLTTDAGRHRLREIERLCHRDFAPRLASLVYQDFPVDGEILFPFRLEVLKKDPDLAPHREALERIQQILLGDDKRGTDLPTPYFAILVADGDHMGATLSELTSSEDHQRFSRQLSGFAVEARRIVEDHHGCLVYSGGDDVLAFLPLDQCVRAARKLHDRFGELMRQGIAVTKPPTLSVGIAIGHCLEPLEDLLRAAREAEKAAKGGRCKDGSDDRNGLAVHLVTRGSDPICVRAQWSPGPNKGLGPDERLERWIGYFLENKLSSRTAYDLHELAREYAGWSKNPDRNLLVQDLERLLRKKRAGGQELSQEVIAALSAEINSREDLDLIAHELVIARHMFEAYQQSAKKPGKADAISIEAGRGQKSVTSEGDPK